MMMKKRRFFSSKLFLLFSIDAVTMDDDLDAVRC